MSQDDETNERGTGAEGEDESEMVAKEENQGTKHNGDVLWYQGLLMYLCLTLYTRTDRTLLSTIFRMLFILYRFQQGQQK